MICVAAYAPPPKAANSAMQATMNAGNPARMRNLRRSLMLASLLTLRGRSREVGRCPRT